MRLLKNAAMMCSLLVSALAMLAILSLRTLPAQTGRGGQFATMNGDADCDGNLTIADPIRLLNYLFVGGAEPCALAQQAPCCPELGEKLDAVIDALKELKNPCNDPMNRFVDNGNGTVTDTCTGVMWQKGFTEHDVDLDGIVDSLFNWNQAANVAKASRVGGYEDWRVPSYKEFEHLIRFLSEKPYQFGFLPEFQHYFRQPVQLWTSTEIHGDLFFADLNPTNLGFSNAGKATKLQLWLVRG